MYVNKLTQTLEASNTEQDISTLSIQTMINGINTNVLLMRDVITQLSIQSLATLWHPLYYNPVSSQ